MLQRDLQRLISVASPTNFFLELRSSRESMGPRTSDEAVSKPPSATHCHCDGLKRDVRLIRCESCQIWFVVTVESTPETPLS